MFAGSVFFLPGKELKPFTVWKADDSTRETANGRVLNNGYAETATFKGILAQAKPAEIERWKQLGHPVTHKIIQQGVCGTKITAGDVLECDGRRFFVQTEPYNPGGINEWTIYYCDDRSDT